MDDGGIGGCSRTNEGDNGMSIPLSVIVITKNEEQNIADCLRSVEWAEEIILVDAASTDRTIEIARTFTPHVFVKEWMGFSAAKQFALDHAHHDWVLWIDADERVTPELAGEIENCVATRNTIAGYRVARRAYFLGQWIKHCGWYPGYVVRLFRRDKAKFSDHNVHEQLIIDEPIETLSHDLLHFTDNSLEHYFLKYNRYTSLAADEMFESGKRARVIDVILRPFLVFFKMYFLKLGFLDGMRGFVLCKLSASYVLTKYAKLWEKENVHQ